MAGRKNIVGGPQVTPTRSSRRLQEKRVIVNHKQADAPGGNIERPPQSKNNLKTIREESEHERNKNKTTPASFEGTSRHEKRASMNLQKTQIKRCQP